MIVYLRGNAKQRRVQLRKLKRTFQHVEPYDWSLRGYRCYGEYSER